MDDLLLIILTLVVTVIGALGQINKKKKSTRQQNHAEGNVPEEEPDNFWDFLNEEAYSQTEQQEEHLPEEEMIEEEESSPQKMDKPQPEPKITKPEYQFTAKNEGQSIYSSEITDKAEEEKRKTKKKRRDFSLRKAVIYSEILNRKYE